MNIQKSMLRKPSFARTKKTPKWSLEEPLQLFRLLALAVPGVGGLLVLLFLVSIRYVPELDLSGSIALLCAVAVVGAFIVVGAGAGALLPAILEFSRDNVAQDSSRKAARQLYCALPGFLCTLFFILQVNGWVFEPVGSWHEAWMLFLLLCVCLGTGAAVTRFTLHLELANSSSSPVQRWAHGAKLAMYLALATLVWLLTQTLAAILLFTLVNGAEIPFRFTLVMMAWSTVILGLNALAIRTGTWLALARSSVVGIGVFILLLIQAGNLTGVAVAALKTLGLTDVPVRLVVTAEGCDILNNAVRGGPVCVMLERSKHAVVCPVILQSRIGSPFLVEFAPLAATGTWPSKDRRQAVQLPREFVRSWPRLDAPQASSDPTPIDPKTPASIVLTWLSASTAAEENWLDRRCTARVERFE